ncbi:restriction endonuclease subunit S [Paraburkholderia caledonica]|uniref:restriction endonuclease subunit S n=1 Tax=Paraburkholderia caledonica TaxID=134536 RepID=UPI0019D19E0E|nr:restriction endonuclease subunit S [Paraburkholderia caledonica]
MNKRHDAFDAARRQAEALETDLPEKRELVQVERQIGSRRTRNPEEKMSPNGWISTPLGACAKFISGGTPSKERDDYWEGDFPWVTAKDMKTLWLADTRLRLTPAGRAVAAIVPPGAILVLTRGMTLLKDLPVGISKRELSFNQDIKALIPVEGINAEFLALQLLGRKKEILALVDTAGHGTGRLDTEQLKQFQVNYPSQREQRAIAETLSVWSNAIEKTDQLVINCRKQKQNFMKSLLSGHRGFGPANTRWKQPAFEEVFERIVRKNTVGNQNVLTISGQHGLISQREYFNKSVASENLQGYTYLERGDFAYNKSYSAGYPVGAIKPLLAYEAGVVSSLYICFRIKPGVEADADFFRHYFEAGMLNDAISGIAQEGARNHGLLNVSVKEFFKLKLRVPSIDAQRRIAEVLSAAESEERCVERQRDKLKEEKLALMADLLTGKRRVRLTESDTAPEAA